MDGDAFLYIKGNDVCLCTTQMNIATVRHFLQEFLTRSGVRKDAASFDLLNAADVGKLVLIKRKGVKEIELSGSLYSASYDYQMRTNEAVGALEKISKHFKAFFRTPHDVSDDGLQMRVTLKVDGRSKGLTLGKKRLEMIATNLIEQQVSDDQYVIVTKDGERIGPDDVYVKSTTEIDAAGKSVSREDAWMKLMEYYNLLLHSGTLEQ